MNRFLNYCTKENKLEEFEEVLQSEGNVNARSSFNHTLLHEAAERLNFDLVKILIQYGAGEYITRLHYIIRLRLTALI